MNRGRWKKRLDAELIGAVLISLAAAVCFFGTGRHIAYSAMDRRFQTGEFMETQEKKYAARLQAYVESNQIASTDLEAVNGWVKREKYVTLTLFQGNKIFYDSLTQKYGSGLLPTADLLYDENFESNYESIRFTDQTLKAVLIAYNQSRYYYIAAAGLGFLAFLVFIVILVWLIHKKTDYIETLERELQILEAGDLEYVITVKGRDELTALALGINHMRRAVIERQQAEQAARDANHQLVTAMSHDLRSPLTALMGYLDLMEMGKYSGEQQLKHFIRSSRKKSYQIKEMSDKLFEYFLVYGREQENPPMEAEPVDAMIFLSQTVCESLFDLESRGFQVEQDMRELRCQILVNVEMCRRVFDNVFSNLVKYADPAWPIRMKAEETGGGLEIIFYNRLNPSGAKAGSTGIGLKTCETIMKQHRGSFSAGMSDTEYVTRIYFPGI